MKKVFVVIFIFALGFVARDLSNIAVKNANATVAGKDFYKLFRDKDFKKAVQYVVESCYVYKDSISC